MQKLCFDRELRAIARVLLCGCKNVLSSFNMFFGVAMNVQGGLQDLLRLLFIKQAKIVFLINLKKYKCIHLYVLHVIFIYKKYEKNNLYKY